MITVLGATGNTGRRVTARLLAEGEEVRAVGRSAETLAATTAQPWVGDATDTAFLTEAFRGAEAAYVLMPFDPTAAGYLAAQERVGESITTALRASGVRRVVALSSLGAEIVTGTGFLTSLHDQEQRLAALTDVDVLLLRPGLFFESFLPALDAIRTHGAHVDSIDPAVALPMVAARDVGDAAAHALLAFDWTGTEVREVLGPCDLTLPEATRVLGDALGMPDLPYVRLPDEEMAGLLREAGLPGDLADLQVAMNRAFTEKTVVGHRTVGATTPTTLQEWLQR